ncbi:MAG: hypothetical protein AB8A47_05625 [Prochlorococcus sp.]
MFISNVRNLYVFSELLLCAEDDELSSRRWIHLLTLANCLSRSCELVI